MAGPNEGLPRMAVAADEADRLDSPAAPDCLLERWRQTRVRAFSVAVPERMERMARVHGVELARAGVDRPTLVVMTERCGTCNAVLGCAEALGEARTSPEGCLFCPNGALFDEIAARQGEHG